MKFPLTLLTVFVCGIILLSLSPVFIASTYETEIRHNDNAGWARFNYSTNTSVDIPVSIAEDVLTLGGPGAQSGALEDMIIWADNNLAVYISDGRAYYMGYNGSSFVNGSLDDEFTISKTANNVIIQDGEDRYNFPYSRWAYVPNANGSYGSFDNGETSHIDNPNINRAYVGGLLGFYAYNNVNTGGYTLNLNVAQNDDVISGASWSGGATNEQ